MDQAFTVRFSRAETAEIDAAAAALNVSRSEVLRRNWRSKSGSKIDELQEHLAAIAEAVTTLADRADSAPPPPTEIGPLRELISDILTAQQRQEKALLALATAVEKLQNARGYGAATGSVNDPRSDEAWARAGAVKTPAQPTPSAPLKPVPGRPDWSAWLQSQPFAFDGETATARMLRVRKIYEQQYGPV